MWGTINTIEGSLENKMKIFNNDTKFNTGRFEPVRLSEIVPRINDYLRDIDEYTIDIGTDSQKHSTTRFVSVVAVHRIGKGGIFFYHPTITEKPHTFRDRIYLETSMSIELATCLLDMFLDRDLLYNITIHCDIGEGGKTKELISEIVGYCTAYGFPCKIKPNAHAAQCIADKFSK